MGMDKLLFKSVKTDEVTVKCEVNCEEKRMEFEMVFNSPVIPEQVFTSVMNAVTGLLGD